MTPSAATARRFEGLWDHAVEGLFRTTADGRPLDVNPALAHALGYDGPADFLARVDGVASLYVDPADRTHLLERLDADGAVTDFEARYRCRDGGEIWLALSARMVADDGSDAEIQGMAIDITERKRAEREVERREEMLAAVTDIAETLLHADDWVTVIDTVLARMGSAAGAGRASLLVNHDRPGHLPITARTNTWTPGVDPLAGDPRLDGLDLEALGLAGWARTLSAGEPIHGPIDQFAGNERRILEAFDVRAIALAPIHVDGAWWGTLSLDDDLVADAWSDAQIGVLRAAANIVGAAVGRHEAMRQLATSEQRLHQLVEAVPIGLTFVDADGRITFANHGAEQILRLEPSDLATRTYDDPAWRIEAVDGGAYPPEELPFAIVSRTGDPAQDVRHAIVHDDGTRTLLSINAAPLTRDGEFAGMVAAITDVTAEHESQEARARLAAIVDSTDDAIVTRDLDGIIATWNRGAEATYGWSAAEAIGQPITLVIPGDQRGDRARIQDVAAAGVVVRDVLAERVRKDGARIHVSITASPIFAADGQARAVASIERDVTESVRARHELERYANELEGSNQELEQFAYVASHDLQEPLRMVSSFLQLLQQRYGGQLDETADEWIGFAVDGASRMQGLIRDLLSFSRVGTRGRPPVPTDAGDVLSRVLRDLGPAIEDTGATIEVADLPVVSADEGQLAQVLQNLIFNALKFHSQAPPRVVVTATADEPGWWRFSVTDNGIGVAVEHRDRVFEIFKRLHTRDEHPGTGIGLAICKKIVERHGGRIWVDDAAGGGAAFHFTLPATTESERP